MYKLFDANCLLCEGRCYNCFHLCPYAHITCQNCNRSANNLNFCIICSTQLIKCFVMNEYQNDLYEELIFKKIYDSGAVILLTEKFFENPGLVHSDPGCESSNNKGHGRLIRCLDCCKCLSSTRIREHFHHEHHRLFICPLPPGGIVSFTVDFTSVDMFELTSLQFFSTQHIVNGEQIERVFSIMATKVPYLIDTRCESHHNVILIWLYSLSYTCHITYTIQALTGRSNRPFISFTGQPMDSNVLNKITNGKTTIEEFGFYLILKESSFISNDNLWSETIVNVFLH